MPRASKVIGQRDGRRVVYELHDDHVAEMLEQVVAHVDHVRLGVSGGAVGSATRGVSR